MGAVLLPLLLWTGTIQYIHLECGGSWPARLGPQRRRRFCFFHSPRSHSPNGPSNPNRPTVLTLPGGEGRGEGGFFVPTELFRWRRGLGRGGHSLQSRK